MFDLEVTKETLLLEDIVGLTSIINNGKFDFSSIEKYDDEVFQLIAAAYRAGKAAVN